MPESYASADDIYCYPGTTVLKNLVVLRSADELEQFEAAMTIQRADEPMPAGDLDGAHYYAIHRHLFQDVYAWAGTPRTIRIEKGSSVFCYPENIPAEIDRLFAGLRDKAHLRGMLRDDFVQALASFLADLNAIHAFREGNGRTQLIFASIIAHGAGFPIDFERLEPEPFLSAMISSFRGDEAPLSAEIRRMISG